MIVLLLSALALGQDAAPELQPSGDITAVTVFPARAAVTRTMSFDVAKGVNELVFTDLPPTLDESSIQAEGAGAEGTRILGLDVQSRELEEDRRERVAELEQRVVEVQDQLSVQRDLRSAAQTELGFLTKLQAAAAGQLSAELLFAADTVADAGAIADLLRTRTPEVQEQIRTANQTERDLQSTLSALQRELGTVRGARQWSRRDVAVTVESPKKGKVSVELTYVVPGASWTPSYDARANPKAGTIALTLHGAVTQTTGEDWSDAALTLSTARPSGGVNPPTLSPFWLQETVYYPTYTEYEEYDEWEDDGDMAFSDDEMYEPEPMMLEADKAGKGRGAPPPPPPKPMAVATAKVVERAVATTFEVPGTAKIPGDGTRRKVRVADVELEAEFVHIAVPRIEEAAFVVGRVTWSQPWPMLAGRVASFMDDAFVGSSGHDLVGQGGELEVGFGRDDAVKVEREIVTDLTSNPNFWGQVTLAQAWTLGISNGRKIPITVELLDRVPVSKAAIYKVRADGDEPDEQVGEGIVRYVREVDPSGEASVAFGYRVRWPRRRPPGAMP